MVCKTNDFEPKVLQIFFTNFIIFIIFVMFAIKFDNQPNLATAKISNIFTNRLLSMKPNPKIPTPQTPPKPNFPRGHVLSKGFCKLNRHECSIYVPINFVNTHNSFPRGKVDFCHRQKDGRVAAPLADKYGVSDRWNIHPSVLPTASQLPSREAIRCYLL